MKEEPKSTSQYKPTRVKLEPSARGDITHILPKSLFSSRVLICGFGVNSKLEPYKEFINKVLVSNIGQEPLSIYNLIASATLAATGAALLALGVGRKRKISIMGIGEITITTSGIVGIILVILAIIVI